MKRILILMVAVMSMTLFAKQIEVINFSIIRPSDSDNKTVAGYAKPGEVYNVKAESGAWHYVEFISGTIHTGKKGWVWRQLIDYTTMKIKGQGVVVHQGPATSSPPVKECPAVLGGTKIKLIKKDVKWYKIGDGKYIYYKNVKVVE